MILLEMDALNLSSNQVEVLRFADQGCATLPGDQPPNAFFEPRLTEGLRVSRRIPLGALGGQPQATFGDIVLTNIDGELDYLRGYAFDGRAFRVWYLDTAPAASMTLPSSETFGGLLSQPVIGYHQVRFKVLDLMPVYFTQPLLTNTYAGTSSAAAGVEGEADSLKGQRKPRLYGSVLNIRPRLVNKVLQIYQVSDQEAVLSFHAMGSPCVFDRGVQIVKENDDYANIADMEARAPAAGRYRQYRGKEGLFLRVGSPPVELTVNASSIYSSPQSIIGKLVEDIGLPTTQYLPLPLPTGDTPSCGLYVEGDATAFDVLRQVCPAENLWWGFDRLNRFMVGEARVFFWRGESLTEADILSIDVVRDGDDGGAPIGSVRVPYQRLHTVQSQVAEGATPSQRALVSEPVRYVTKRHSTAGQRKLARQIDINTNMASEHGATMLAYRCLSNFGNPRDRLDVTLQCTSARLLMLEVGKTIKVQHDRFGLAAGKEFLIVGLEVELGRGIDTVRLSLWG
ncbi:hypothetical protein ACUHMQ_13470 [Chitinimonas sp. PSY-7]|uniref:hypothetical protein n=1 Tax=Chitinimonas sp. PSY-7 TaxID=3459088 RepID=UPI00404035B7